MWRSVELWCFLCRIFTYVHNAEMQPAPQIIRLMEVILLNQEVVPLVFAQVL